MHIPDGYLDIGIAALFYLISAGVIAFATVKVRKEFSEKNIPLLGVVAAGIFAAQMLNWPIPGGTSAHLVGGGVAACLLGIYPSILALTTVVGLQALIFADGGIGALGANLWNMAVIAVIVSYVVFKVLSKKNVALASFLAGWLGITLGATFAGMEIGLSSVFAYELSVTVPTMFLWHAALGVVEGFITMGVVSYVSHARPDLVVGVEVKV